MAGPPGKNRAAVVRRITATLRGPVLDVLGDLVPEVKRLPRRGALEAILDDIDLLHRCFLAFRASPERFRHLLVDRHKVRVEDADALLECGRSLDLVTARVVRTAAKRHFRRRLDGPVKALNTRPGHRPPPRSPPPTRGPARAWRRLTTRPPKPWPRTSGRGCPTA